MSTTAAASPRKSLAPFERQFLKTAGEELAKVKLGGPAALAALLDMVASWHACRSEASFSDYGRQWLAEGNARTGAADRLLRDLFGLDRSANA